MRRATLIEVTDIYKNLYLPYLQEVQRFGLRDGMPLYVMMQSVSRVFDLDVIEFNGNDVGFVLSRDMGDYRHIMGLYVSPECRRKHLARESVLDVFRREMKPLFAVVLNDASDKFWWNFETEYGLIDYKMNPEQQMLAALHKPYFMGVREDMDYDF